MPGTLKTSISPDTAATLGRTACQVRRDVLRMVYDGGSGHCGGSLSIADILIVLYYHAMNIRPEEPLWPERDRFVLSKGHACPALYAVLAKRGFFPEAELKNFRRTGSMLQGHPEYSTPGVEAVGGSLGQGFSTALGMALGLKMKGAGPRVYAVLGDGEIQEGMVWETAMAAGHFRLANLTCFIDRNRLQGDGRTEDIMGIEPVRDKWLAFNWEVLEIDGNDIVQIAGAIDLAREVTSKPQMIIANTVKGKGVSFMEDVAAWHGTSPPTDEQLALAMKELQAAEEGIG